MSPFNDMAFQAVAHALVKWDSGHAWHIASLGSWSFLLVIWLLVILVTSRGLPIEAVSSLDAIHASHALSIWDSCLACPFPHNNPDQCFVSSSTWSSQLLEGIASHPCGTCYVHKDLSALPSTTQLVLQNTWYVIQIHSVLCLTWKEKWRKQKTAPFGVNEKPSILPGCPLLNMCLFF